MRSTSLLTTLFAFALIACGGATGPEPDGTNASEGAPLTEATSGRALSKAPSPDYQPGQGIIIMPTQPCPSSWCGENTACVTWECKQPILLGATNYQCTSTVAAAGTNCTDPNLCIKGGTCDGKGACDARPGGREVCVDTDAGVHDGYQCGLCYAGVCEAQFGGNVVHPAPAFACVLETR